jgi:hypothetical protein
VVKLLAGMGFEVHVHHRSRQQRVLVEFPVGEKRKHCPMPYEQMKLFDYV